MSKFTALLTAAHLGVLILPAYADTQFDEQENLVNAVNALPTAVLPGITVTANRVPTRIKDTLIQTRVIETAELDMYRGQSALDVITQQPGVSFYQSGGRGTTANFYMRGFDNKQILVLIDGVRYGSVSDGGAALHLLPTEHIDRIEILYGTSGASLYGAEAMGGVIHIFSKGHLSGSTTNSASVTVGAGSNNERLYQGQLSLQQQNSSNTTFDVSVSRVTTDGINATLPNNYAYNPDKDGFEQDGVSLALIRRINPSTQVGVTGLYGRSISEFDNGLTENQNTAQLKQNNGAIQGFIDWQHSANGSIKLSHGRSIDEIDNRALSSQFTNRYEQVSLTGQQDLLQTFARDDGTSFNEDQAFIDDDVSTAQIDNSKRLTSSTLLYGIEHSKESLHTNNYEADDRDVLGQFLGYQFATDLIDGQFNIRRDDYSDFADQINYSAGLALHVHQDLRVGGNHATGFRPPSYNDLYFPGSQNPDLKPESSKTSEVFIEYSPIKQDYAQITRLTGYLSELDDVLTFVADYDEQDNYLGGRSQNISAAKIKGLSLVSDWYLNDFQVGMSYDYQETVDTSGSVNDDNALPIRPKNQGKVYVAYYQPNFDMRVEYQHVDDYYSGIENLKSQLVDDYGLLNLTGKYQISKNVVLNAKINNVLDKEYVTLPTYRTDGINYLLSITYQGF